MTTIVYRDGWLAADTMMSAGGDCLAYGVKKIAIAADGTLAAAAGDATYCAAFLRWFLGGRSGEPPEARESERSFDRGALFFAGGLIRVYEPNGWFDCQPPYYAMGSGRSVALGALHAGANALDAVKAAIAHDAGTGGEVTWLRHELGEGDKVERA